MEVDEKNLMNFKLVVFVILPIILVATILLYNFSNEKKQWYLDITSCADVSCVDQ